MWPDGHRRGGEHWHHARPVRDPIALRRGRERSILKLAASDVTGCTVGALVRAEKRTVPPSSANGWETRGPLGGRVAGRRDDELHGSDGVPELRSEQGAAGSAGAYLAAQLSLDRSYLRAHGLDLSDIRGTVPISPFLYVEEVAPDRPKTVWGTDEAVWREASVKPYIDSGRPPMLLIYADGDDDWRREQNERLKMELKGAGNSDVDAVEIADRTHGSILSKMAEAGDPGMSRIAAFIKSH